MVCAPLERRTTLIFKLLALLCVAFFGNTSCNGTNTKVIADADMVGDSYLDTDDNVDMDIGTYTDSLSDIDLEIAVPGDIDAKIDLNTEDLGDADEGTDQEFNADVESGCHWYQVTAPTEAGLRSISGVNDHTVIAVGSADFNWVAVAFDGSDWTGYGSGPEGSLQDVWIDGSSSVAYAVGTDAAGFPVVMRHSGDKWVSVDVENNCIASAVWMASENDVFIVGFDGVLLHTAGNGWTVTTISDHAMLLDVWGTAVDDVYAVGHSPEDDEGKIYHYNGSEWTEVFSHTYPLSGIWGFGPDDVVAVGLDAEIVHYNGTTWTEMLSNTTSGGVSLRDVWGSSGTDIWAVGGAMQDSQAVILHYNGEEWVELKHGFKGWLNGIWGAGPESVFAVGSDFAGNEDPYILQYTCE